MRTRLVLALAFLLSSLSSPGAGAQPGAAAGFAQEAFATWMVKTTPTGGVAYFVDVQRSSPTPDGITTLAFIGKMHCVVQRSRNFVVTMCSGAAKGVPLDLDDFQLDPLLSSGAVEVKHKGSTHQVTWTGQGALPEIGQGAVVGEGGAGAGAGMGRSAVASGKVFGNKVGGRSRDDWAFMTQESYAYVFTGANLSRTTLADGRVRFDLRVRSPR